MDKALAFPLFVLVEKGTLTFTHTAHPSFGGSMTQIFYKKAEGYLLTEVSLTGAEGETLSIHLKNVQTDGEIPVFDKTAGLTVVSE